MIQPGFASHSTVPAPTLKLQTTIGVLVVDDEESVRGFLYEALTSLGYNVWLATTGEQAVDVYQTVRERINVALLDVFLGGMDGPTTLALLREIDPHLGCCFMSGYVESNTFEQLRAMAVRFLPKPFSLAEVASVIKVCADESAGVQSSSGSKRWNFKFPTASSRPVSEWPTRTFLATG
jgi:CheY-like chemotaxis protein